MVRLPKQLLLLLVPLLVVSCATPRGTEQAPATLRIENDLIPPTSLTIYAVPEVGSRSLIGMARSGESTTLTFDAASASDYTFVAQTASGREIVSDEITLGVGDGAIWSLNANVIVPM